jgi:hypothetical protein
MITHFQRQTTYKEMPINQIRRRERHSPTAPYGKPIKVQDYEANAALVMPKYTPAP